MKIRTIFFPQDAGTTWCLGGGPVEIALRRKFRGGHWE
jgi:hypothetical protein